MLGGPYLVEQSLAAARESPTAAAVIAEAERNNVPVYVLPEEEYSARFPGSAGVSTEDGIYVPVSSVDEPNEWNVLVHEYVHAVVGEAFNVPDSADREAAIRENFERIGLDPEDGARIAQQTAWPEELTGFTDEHVATWVIGNDVQRELAGLPEATPEERDALISRAAERELAITLTNKRTNEPGYTDEQFIADWNRTPQGQRTPLPGNTDAERARALDNLLARYREERYVLGGGNAGKFG